MSDKITGYLEVGLNDAKEIVVNHPNLITDENGAGHIVFSPNQARDLAELLLKHAAAAEKQARDTRLEAQRNAATAIPVDREARVLTDGSPVTEAHREIDPSSGQQKDYVVLTPEERSKGFVRPVRHSYTHKTCGVVTRMGNAIAETYARDPKFYSGTFCVQCRAHRPLSEFVWAGTDETVGS